MSDDIELVRSRSNIVELVGEQVRLKRAGKNWKGLCPFHDDKNPSFSVSETTGSYRCWSCGAKGDVFNWVMETQRITFPEALEYLAKRAGVALSKAPAGPSKRGGQDAAMETALRFFNDQLTRSRPARDYMAARGLDEGVRITWEIGYGPEVGDALAQQLKREGHSLIDAEALFLVQKDQSGSFYDRFRSRLIFPIRDERGRLVAFGGRIVGAGEPKYINSSDTPLYSKRRVLYGMHRAKDAMTKSDRAVLVEGYLDVIACHRAGVEEAVASLGTSLSEEHARLLARWCKHVTVLYDADAAGQKAAERAAEVLEEAGLHVKIALMPQGEDPDTLLATQGAQAVRRACEQGIAPLEFALQRVAEAHPQRGPEYWKDVVVAFARARSDLELERLLPGIAAQYPDIRDPVAAQQALKRQIASSRKAIRPAGSDAAPAAVRLPEVSMKNWERALFRCLLDPKLAAEAWPLLEQREGFATGAASQLAEAITSSLGPIAPHEPPAVWLARVDPPEARSRLADLDFRDDLPPSPAAVIGAREHLKKNLEKREVHQLRQVLQDDDQKLREINERYRRLKAQGSSEDSI